MVDGIAIRNGGQEAHLVGARVSQAQRIVCNDGSGWSAAIDFHDAAHGPSTQRRLGNPVPGLQCRYVPKAING